MMKQLEILICLLLTAVICCLGAVLSLPQGERMIRYSSGRTAVTAGEKNVPDGRICINTADPDELIRLPGIGPALAQAIVEEREAHGFFHYPEDLMSVWGIGRSKLDQFRGELNFNIYEGD